MMKRIKRLFNRRNSAGFTLVEVIVATALLGVLLVGIIFFISPIFQNVETEGQITKADRATTTMEWYVSKTLRSAVFVKAYVGVEFEDVNTPTGYISIDATTKSPSDPNSGQLKDMVDLVASAPGNYELRCLSFQYVEDTNVSNSSFSNSPRKYMIFNEKVTITDSTPKLVKIDTTASAPVFEACFYEDIYPEFSFDVEKVYLTKDESGKYTKTNYTEDDVAALSAEEQAKLLGLTPYIKMGINIYGDEGYATTNRAIFRASSIIEVNNVKNYDVNEKGYYKLFDTDIVRDVSDPGTEEDQKNIFVFYVARKLGTTQKAS